MQNTVYEGNDLFHQYANQTLDETNTAVVHTDGHLDGSVADRHTDEHADRPSGR